MHRILWSSLVLALTLSSASVHAQQWPQKPVKIIVPYAPGGNADTMGRITAQWLTG
jgi:tripartite-type tricarboxylate transporter receptor subunit TctC